MNKLYALTVLVFVLLLAACGSPTPTAVPATALPPPTAVPATAVPLPTSVPPTAVPQPTAVPATAVPQPTAVPPTAVPKPTAVPTVLFPTGTFQLKDTPDRGLQFNKDNTYAVLAGGNHVVEGTYSVKGDVYTELSNNANCPTPMDYKFSFDGANLKFQPVADPAKDPCDGRKGDFNNSKTWVLMPAPATLAAVFPTGTFQLKDTPDRGLQFNKDNTYAVLAGGNHVVEGTYSVKGDVYTELSNNANCPTPMDYTFTFDGANLKFQPVADPAKDPCDGRKGDFNDSKTWVLMPAPAALAVVFPTGTFQLKDTPDRGLQFNKDNTYAVLAGGNHVVEGTYSVKGDVYTELSNNANCPTPMDYKFSFDGANLKFQPVADPAKDPCDGRKGDFNNSKTWVLMP